MSDANELVARALREDWPLPRFIDEVERMPPGERDVMILLMIEHIAHELNRRRNAT